MDLKLGGCASFGGVEAGSPCNTMWPGPKPACTSSFILIHPTVWPQYTNVTDRYAGQTGQTRSDSIGRTVFSEGELMFAFAKCYRPSVCLSSITLVHPTEVVEIFGNISTAFVDIDIKFYGDRPRETRPPGKLNTRVVAKYSDFGPTEGYISETVKDRR